MSHGLYLRWGFEVHGVSSILDQCKFHYFTTISIVLALPGVHKAASFLISGHAKHYKPPPPPFHFSLFRLHLHLLFHTSIYGKLVEVSMVMESGIRRSHRYLRMLYPTREYGGIEDHIQVVYDLNAQCKYCGA
jgi:hypothetical protein